MNAALPKSIPALISFPQSSARKDGWGTLARLSAQDVEILSLTRLSSGEDVFLSFDILGERFAALAAQVLRAQSEPDGYVRATLRFDSQDSRDQIARTVLGLLGKSATARE